MIQIEHYFFQKKILNKIPNSILNLSYDFENFGFSVNSLTYSTIPIFFAMRNNSYENCTKKAQYFQEHNFVLR